MVGQIQESPAENSISVLVVDDSAGFRHMTRVLLKRSTDITVVGEAEDGAEAIERVCELQPQVILLDVMMPKVSGIEALPKILALCPESKVIMLSASSREEVIAEAFQKGAWCYMVKGDCDVPETIRAVVRGEMRQFFVGQITSKYESHEMEGTHSQVEYL
jgi:DNA-binding NarL/FixJ family response regulator